MFPPTLFFLQGHAIEAGWFLLRYAQRQHDSTLLSQTVEKFIKQPFHSGWDSEHGGLFAFQDVDGLCPTQVWALVPKTYTCRGFPPIPCHHCLVQRSPVFPFLPPSSPARVENEALVAAHRGHDSFPDGVC